ncbi:hypothetical protein AB1286_12145 [Trinickia sp. NRRL B-1857]|uniref:hypothetical protein n=1 Tax=Trinickia sp. NRRL B-1857 TaxID=3162879 RepID=UPI003D2C7561
MDNPLSAKMFSENLSDIARHTVDQVGFAPPFDIVDSGETRQRELLDCVQRIAGKI